MQPGNLVVVGVKKKTGLMLTLGLCFCGLGSQALSVERWVAPSRWAAPSALESAPGPIPLAASVMHYRPAPGRRVFPEACAESSGGLPLLGRTVADEMPDKCDDKLWGRWSCNSEERAWDGSPRYKATEYTFSRTIGEGGYEHVRLYQQNQGDRGGVTQNWKVDQKWHPAPRGWYPVPAGRLAFATCNGRNKFGYRILAVHEKNPDGSGRTAVEYYVDSAGTGWEETYETWWKGDKMYEKQLRRIRCDRET